MNFRTLAIHNMLRLYKNVGQTAYNNPQLARAAFERLADVIPGRLDGCEYKRIDIDGVPAEWVIPRRAKDDKVLLFLHGGGYATGSIRTHRGLVSQIAIHAGIKALSVQYDLAPEHKFPTQIEQCVSAYIYLLEEGYAPENIAIGGESAGGGLTGGTLHFIKDRKLPMPACAIMMSPWLDLTGSGRSMITNKHKDPMMPQKGIPLWARNYAGDAELTNPYASPLFGELSGLCPVYIQVGECEVLLSDSTRYAEKAEKAGVDITMEVWPNMFHAWQGFWMIIPEGKAAIEKLGIFLKKQLRITIPKTYKTPSH